MHNRIVFTLFGILELVAVAYLATYFGLNSRMLRDDLRATFDAGVRPGAIRFKGLQVGPSLRSVRLIGVEIAQADGEKVIVAPYAEATLDLLQSDLSGRVHLRDVQIRDFYLLLEWTAKSFHFVDAFKSGRPPSKKPKKKSRIDLDFRGIRLQNGVVELKFPSWRIRFDGVHIEGAFSLGNGLQIDAEIRQARGVASVAFLAKFLRRGELSPIWRKRIAAAPGGVFPFSSLRLSRFVWRHDGFELTKLELVVDDSTIGVGGRIGFHKGLQLDTRLTARFKGAGSLATAISLGELKGDLDLDLQLVAKIPSPLSVSKLLELAGSGKNTPISLRVRKLSSPRVRFLGVELVDAWVSFKSALVLNGVSDHQLKISSFDFRSKQGKMRGSAEFDVGPAVLSKNKYRVETVFEKLQLSQIVRGLRLPALRRLRDLGAWVSGRLKLSGVIDCASRYCVPPTTYSPRAPSKVSPDLVIGSNHGSRRLTVLESETNGARLPELTIDFGTGELRFWNYRGILAAIRK
ncbi:MAG: hypothetical protein KC609_20565 [Myxococcales bacterium]|nr:hypothetical protein [Myxococcales bacterium]